MCRFPFARFALASLLLLFLANCSLLPQFSCDPAESLARKPTLPGGVTLEDESCNMLRYEATFAIAPADLAAFQASTGIEEWATSNRSTLFATPQYEEQASRASSYLYGEFSNGIDLIVVLIDTSDSQRYLVYYDASYID